MSRMYYEHSFSEKSKESLHEFIETSKISETCNLQPIHTELNKWKPFIKNLVDYIELVENEPDMPTVHENIKPGDVCETSSEIQNIHILEEKCNKNDFSPHYLVEIMQKEPLDRIQDIYRNVINHINVPTVVEMGNLIQNMNLRISLIECYCRELLLKKMLECSEDDLYELFNIFYSYNCGSLVEQIVHFLKKEEKLDIFLVYLNRKSISDKEFFPSLLRSYLQSTGEIISIKDLFIIDYFSSKSTEYEMMKVLINILHKNAEEYKTDKNYGKLLMKIVDNLGPQIQPLKVQIYSILDIHTSIWKIKITKKIEKML